MFFFFFDSDFSFTFARNNINLEETEPMKLKRCPNCGAEISSLASVCPNCQAALEMNAEEATQWVRPVPAPSSASTGYVQPPMPQGGNGQGGGTTRVVLIIIITALVVFLLCFGGYMLYANNKANQEKLEKLEADKKAAEEKAAAAEQKAATEEKKADDAKKVAEQKTAEARKTKSSAKVYTDKGYTMYNYRRSDFGYYDNLCYITDTDWSNIRSAPGKEGLILCRVKQGSYLAIGSSYDGWCECYDPNGNFLGYIHYSRFRIV